MLVLPGVGAFGPAASALASGRTSRARDAIAAGLPCLGICLGMQLMFDASEEGAGAGLGVFAGRVTKLRAPRTPQIGWNSIDDARDPLFDEAGLGIAYYANSFACRPADDVGGRGLVHARGRPFPRCRADPAAPSACSFIRRRARHRVSHSFVHISTSSRTSSA